MPTGRPPTRRALSNVPAACLALALLGCGSGTVRVNDVCPTMQSTGGDPTGTWVVTDSCQVPYPRTGTTDWCSQLVYGDGIVKDGLVLGQNFIPVKLGGASTITYTADETMCPKHDCGTYSAVIVFEGPTTTKFPHGCLVQHMANPSCSDLQTQINALAINTLPNVVDLTCKDDGSGGCNCSYTYTTGTVAGDVGFWRVQNGLLVHYPSLPALAAAYPADVQINGDVMELHGHGGIGLLSHDSLHNLTLMRAPPTLMRAPAGDGGSPTTDGGSPASDGGAPTSDGGG